MNTEKRLLALESALTRLGVDVRQSLDHCHKTPAMTCIHNGIVVEAILRDLWGRLGIRGSATKRQLEMLLTNVTRSLEEFGTPIPRRVYDYIRAIQQTRNRAAHYADVNEADAMESLRHLSDVAYWYFVDFFGELPADSKTPPPELTESGEYSSLDHRAQIDKIRQDIAWLVSNRLSFTNWYRVRFAWIIRRPRFISIPVQVLIWLLYGVLWIPVWFLMSMLWQFIDPKINAQVDLKIRVLTEQLERLEKRTNVTEGGE